MAKVIVYCPIGKDLEMFKFSSDMAIERSGMNINFIPVTGWNTSKEVYDFIKEKGWTNLEVKNLKENDWLYNLYKCWNRGYDAFDELEADIVVPMGSDHAFYFKWLEELVKYSKPNRIVNCKLIENGLLPSLHTCINFGMPGKDFKEEDFQIFCHRIWNEKLVKDEIKYGRRLDAMPFAVTKDIWEKFGPMIPMNEQGITGDTLFFNNCKAGGVEITKSLSSISYHIGAASTNKIK